MKIINLKISPENFSDENKITEDLFNSLSKLGFCQVKKIKRTKEDFNNISKGDINEVLSLLLEIITNGLAVLEIAKFLISWVKRKKRTIIINNGINEFKITGDNEEIENIVKLVLEKNA